MHKPEPALEHLALEVLALRRQRCGGETTDRRPRWYQHAEIDCGRQGRRQETRGTQPTQFWGALSILEELFGSRTHGRLLQTVGVLAALLPQGEAVFQRRKAVF